MSEKWLGIMVASDKVTLVYATVPNSGPIIINADETFTLQKGGRPKAYELMFHRVADYAKDNGISQAVVKESALSLGGTKLSHLTSAELRGVVMCALATVCETKSLSKSMVSRKFGDRKTDEYLKDEDFWRDHTTGKSVRIGSREAVIYMLASRAR